MKYLKIAVVSALTGGIALLSYANEAEDKTTIDKPENGDKKTDKALSDKKTRMNEKNTQGGIREEVQAYMDKLSQEDRAKLRELHQQDPEKFRKVLKTKILELKKRESGFQKDVNAIVEKYHKAKTAEDKQKYLVQLKETSKKEFDRNLERSKTELDNLEKRLNTLRQAYENRKQHAARIVDDQVEYLTRNPSLNW